MSIGVSFDVDTENLERNIYCLIGFYEMYGNAPDIPCLSGLKRKREDLLDKIMRQIQEMGFVAPSNFINGLVEFYETYGTNFNIPCLVGLKRKRDNYINDLDDFIRAIVENGQNQF
ncbi:hypothetical protein HYV88_03550 [Candidatus Woesearchaeota archaeon]|nr:hypothetical protein [Candidatus Woesearchaeota archaeon]